MPQPQSEADIIFPHLSNTPNLSSTLSSLRRSTLSLHNRLSSINADSLFITSVAEAYALPLVANERCGSWYIPPSLKSSSVYFKSTDGHMGEWGFSLRRLNLQLLDVVGKWGGAVIVDSTRRGKSMPDALSKTVPIWCCVMNRALFGHESESHELFTPPQAVSESEHAQIARRIDGLVRQFLDICKPDIPLLRAKLQKPLRPIWVTQQSTIPLSPPLFLDFHPLVLCTASRRVRGAEVSENGYIQGAADDHEAWSGGLTPTLFWENKDLLMSTSEEDQPGVIERLIREEKGGVATATLIEPTTDVYISSSENVDLKPFHVVISCTPGPLPSTSLKEADVKYYLPLECQTGKLGSRDLRTQLPQLVDFFRSLPSPLSSKILVCCPTGKDLAVGAALAILCLYADAEGTIDVSKKRTSSGIGKALIKQRLSWITTSNPALNPSRATLQSVNAVLLESQDPKAVLDKTDYANGAGSKHTLAIRETRPVPHEPEVGEAEDQGRSSPDGGPPCVSSTIFDHFATATDRPWKFTRTLRSTLPTHPSGTVTGSATFTPCTFFPPPSTSSAHPPTLLYAEEGDFITDTGLRFTARRKYVYQLTPSPDDATPCIAVHFFDDAKMPYAAVADGVGAHGEGIGGLFVAMGEFDRTRGVDAALEARNKEQHLCAEDLYTASWKFSTGMTRGGQGVGDGESWWEVRYDVKGPKKDYVSRTRYTRV